ncbi:cell wall-binding repeat-containing protein [Clostridioides difficile]|nr:cell wall-binding repeat-containing protein [Clostridioides difficile]
MKISKKIISLLIVSFLSIVLSSNIVNASNKDTLIGSGRWETAIKISQNGWSKTENAVLVNDNSIADALSATPFAKLKDAPILLSGSQSLDSRAKSELKRLGVRNVFLVGGYNSLSIDIEKQLKSEKITVERISGNDRYETSLKLAEKLDKEKNISDIFVVNGEKGLADAVSVGSIAAQNYIPIILSDFNKGIEVSNRFIKTKDIKNSYIVGGLNSISSVIEKSLPNPKRIAGNNRNETNAKTIKEFYKETDLRNVYVTKDGMKKQSDLIDSLSVGVLAAKNSSPVILVGNKLDSTQKDVLNTKIFSTVTQVGGMGNENAYKDILDMQQETKYTVETIEELNSALKKADANDIIKFRPEKKISESFKLETDKAINVDLSGEYSQSITINMPNGDINNSGDINRTLTLKDIKDGTLINSGYINQMDISDDNGCKIENENDGQIWLITIFSSAKDVNIRNNGTITKIDNNSSSTNIRNSGKIDTVSGNKEPGISGNEPNINNTDKDEDSDTASGLSPRIASCSPIENDYIMLMVPQKPKNSSYKIYYRVLSYKPSAIKVGTKINLNDWNLVENTNPFKVNAKNGSYIEVVEIDYSRKKVTRWGRAGTTDDGFKVVASGIKSTISATENSKVTISVTGYSGDKIYYRIKSMKPEPMNIGDKIDSSWKSTSNNDIVLDENKVNGFYVELASGENNKVEKWGVTDKIEIIS